MKKTEEFLEQLGIKRAYGDFESFKRFNDGGQYRFEVPGIQSPKIMDTLLKEASKNEITIHRITQTKGIMLLTDEEITEELRKQFKMQGLILADSNIVRKMDTNLVSGSSNIVPAYIGKDGEVSDKQNTLNRKQFENLQNYMEKIIKQISEEILNGNIGIEPYYRTRDKKTPCEYCSYKAICQFNQTTKNNYNYIPNVNKEKVLEKICQE